MSNNNSSSSGIPVTEVIGIVIAVILSWGINHSIGWAILHGILSWIYVIYYVCVYTL